MSVGLDTGARAPVLSVFSLLIRYGDFVLSLQTDLGLGGFVFASLNFEMESHYVAQASLKLIILL